MKKIQAFILALLLLVGFSACSAPQINTENSGISTNTETTIEPTNDHTETIAQLPMTAISVPAVTETQAAEDGTVLFRYTYQNMSLILPNPEVADKIIVDFLNRTDIQNDVATLSSQANDAYKVSPANWTAFLAHVVYQPMRIDTGVLSMYGTYSSYNGAVHGETIYQSVSYDLLTGDVLTLSDVLTTDTNPESLSQTILDTLNSHKDAASFYKGYQDIIKARFNDDFLQQTDWFLSDTGLCFFFSPYEIGPYSIGDIVIEIPYAQLTGVLKDAYFPPERQKTSGAIQSESFDQNDLEKYTQFAEVILDNDGTKQLLFTDSAVYDIRLEIGSAADDNAAFIPETTIFCAYSLTPGDAVMIQAKPLDDSKILRLSYTTDGKTEYQYISIDGSLNEAP